MALADAEAKLKEMQRDVSAIRSPTLREEFEETMEAYREIIKHLRRCYH